jgi:hypothetical protein
MSIRVSPTAHETVRGQLHEAVRTSGTFFNLSVTAGIGAAIGLVGICVFVFSIGALYSPLTRMPGADGVRYHRKRVVAACACIVVSAGLIALGATLLSVGTHNSSS